MCRCDIPSGWWERSGGLLLLLLLLLLVLLAEEKGHGGGSAARAEMQWQPGAYRARIRVAKTVGVLGGVVDTGGGG